MFTPICVPCAREMRCRKNEYLFTDYGGAAIWSGDMYACESCKAQVVIGVGREPVAHENEPAFARRIMWANFELTRGGTVTTARRGESVTALIRRADRKSS
jgi:hypothetical protein